MERFMIKREPMSGTGRINPGNNTGIYVNGHYINPRYLLSATAEDKSNPGFLDEPYDTIEMADPE